MNLTVNGYGKFLLVVLVSGLLLACRGGGAGGGVSESSDGVSNSGLTAAVYPSAVDMADCPLESFIDVAAHPANAAYAAPELEVTCEGGDMVIVSNNMPNFEYVSTSRGEPTPSQMTYRLPQNPEFAAVTTGVPTGGVSAIAVNGVVIFGPTEGTQEDPYLNGILDYCNGHIEPSRGTYHFHARPECLFEEFDGQVGVVVAWALDGFPILAPYLCEDVACETVKEVHSSWADTNPETINAWERHEYVEGQSELDICNGMLFEDGSYAYFATETFPYFMGCYRGTPINVRPGRPG